MHRRPRFILATPICDGHDVAICAITRILRREGTDAVYIGFNKSPRQIVKAAVEEDATAIALSSYNGGHMSFFRETLEEAKRQGIPRTPLFCGGGGTILARDVEPLERLGVAKVYRPPLDLTEACRDMLRRARELGANGPARPPDDGADNGANGLARRLTELECGRRVSRGKKKAQGEPGKPARVFGIGGRGGAGKSTLIDEIACRFLAASSDGRLAILSLDPTLADRVRMLYCYSPRVFLRSVAVRPGESVETRVVPLIDELRARDFDLVLVESVGLGQNDLGVAPFVDVSVYVMTCEYGSDLQLEKEALLGRSEIVVMNKSDYPQADAKARRVRQHLESGQRFIATRASRHGDDGVDRLFATLCELASIEVKPPPSLPERGEPADDVPFFRRTYLGDVVDAHRSYYREMDAEIAAAHADPGAAQSYLERFEELWRSYGFDAERDGTELSREGEPVVCRRDAEGSDVPIARRTTCGLWVPVIALPPRDSTVGEIVRYLYKQNVPGRFPFTEGAYLHRRRDENPIRMFAGLGLPETTNRRFHLLAERGGAPRLSTAFDSLTLYGLDSDEPGALAKVGEGGVAVDTVEDMLRLYDGLDLERTSVSMTINGPAPTLLAMYLVAARRRGLRWSELRGTVQTDILKEIQAQNECIFPIETSLRLIADMVEFTIREAPRWYPLSISGYHIGEAGANPVQELAFTLANGLTYVELLRSQGLSLEEFTQRFSFFFTCGSELEFNVLGRVARRIWAIAMSRCYGVQGTGQRLKFHTQTSGRSLQDTGPLHNLARVTLQAERALHNSTNSLHTNSYKEAYSTPEEDDVALAMGCQQIPLLETGDFRFTENLNQGSYGLSYLEDEVERAVHRIFREIDRQGGVIASIENEYFRAEIQEEVQKEQEARRSGEKTIVGVNYLVSEAAEPPRGGIVHIPLKEKRRQVARTREFKRRHRKEAREALRRLQEVATGGGNLFEALIDVVEVATVGQVTRALWEVCGRFRPSF